MTEPTQMGVNIMRNSSTSRRGYFLAVVLGALGGCIAAMLVTKAIPKLMSQIMSEMMSKMPHLMMDHMKREGFDPAEMCQRMRKLFNEPDESLASKGTQSA